MPRAWDDDATIIPLSVRYSSPTPPRRLNAYTYLYLHRLDKLYSVVFIVKVGINAVNIRDSYKISSVSRGIYRSVHGKLFSLARATHRKLTLTHCRSSSRFHRGARSRSYARGEKSRRSSRFVVLRCKKDTWFNREAQIRGTLCRNGNINPSNPNRLVRPKCPEQHRRLKSIPV